MHFYNKYLDNQLIKTTHWFLFSVFPWLDGPVASGLWQLIMTGAGGDVNHLPHDWGVKDEQRKGQESYYPFKRMPPKTWQPPSRSCLLKIAPWPPNRDTLGTSLLHRSLWNTEDSNHSKRSFWVPKALKILLPWNSLLLSCTWKA